MVQKISLLLGLLIFLGGCGKSIPTNYYTLQTSFTPITKDSLPKTTLRVARVAIPQYLDREKDASILGVNSVQVWAEPLGDGIRRVLQTELTPKLLEQNITVLPLGSEDTGTYTLLVDILRFEGELNAKANLIAQWSLVSSTSNNVITNGIYSAEEQLNNPTYHNMVEALSNLTKKLAAHILERVSNIRRLASK